MPSRSVSSLDPAILLHWPAIELRVFHNAAEKQKHARWVGKWLTAGGKLYEGRMIALKNDPIWRAMTGAKRLRGEVSRANIFIGCDVTRKEAVAFGLIQPSHVLERTAFNDENPAFLTRPYSRALDAPH